jgi:hypothetical protein
MRCAGLHGKTLDQLDQELTQKECDFYGGRLFFSRLLRELREKENKNELP